LTNVIRYSAFYALLLVSAIPASSQTSTREVSFAIGATQFDASGTGTGPVAAIRLGAPLVGNWMLGDVSLSYASLDEQFSPSNTRVGVGEAQLQAQVPTTRVRPYVGLGGGWLHYFNNAAGRSATTPTISGSAGVRLPVSSALLVRGEFRLRSWKSGTNSGFHNNAAEFTAGMGYTF
jgi:hypothetical protein